MMETTGNAATTGVARSLPAASLDRGDVMIWPVSNEVREVAVIGTTVVVRFAAAPVRRFGFNEMVQVSNPGVLR